MQTARAAASIAAAVAILVTSSGCAASTAAGSCAAKKVVLGESSLQPGGEVRFSVDWMTAVCEDTGGTNRAATGMTVSIEPASTDEVRTLGTIATATGPHFTARGTFALPADLPVGEATLRIESSVGDLAEAVLPVTIASD